jgi:hypothetical protein
MPVKIHHPVSGKAHNYRFLVVQVVFAGPRTAKLSGNLYKLGGSNGDTLVTPEFQGAHGNLYYFLYGKSPKLSGDYRFQAQELHRNQDGNYSPFAEDDVVFTVKPMYDTPVPAWPLAGDTVTSNSLMAYGTCADPVTVAANQTLVPSPTVPTGAEQTVSATSVGYDPVTQWYWAIFPSVNNGNYLLTIVDDNNDPVQENPVAIQHS